MATILDHPDKDKKIDEETFDLGEGSVTIRTLDGTPLTMYQCIGLLESLKALILDAWLSNN